MGQVNIFGCFKRLLIYLPGRWGCGCATLIDKHNIRVKNIAKQEEPNFCIQFALNYEQYNLLTEISGILMICNKNLVK